MNKNYPLLVLSIFLAAWMFSCRHKKEQVKAVEKSPPGKQVSKGKLNGPGGHGEPFPHNANTLNEKLGLTDKQIRQSKLYSFVDDWYGTPYRYGGCKKNGVDCSCFTNILYETVYGVKVGRSATEIFDQCKKMEFGEAREGDILFFKINSKAVTHVGVFLKKKLFVHASTSRGVIINSLDEAYYKKFFFCAGRMKSL